MPKNLNIKDRSNYPFSLNEKTISVSKIMCLMQCRQKYYFKYELKIKEELKYWLTRGVIFHSLTEEFLYNQDKELDYFVEKGKLLFDEADKDNLLTLPKYLKKDQVLNHILGGFSSYYKHVKDINGVNTFEYYDGKNAKQSIELEFRIPFYDVKTMKPIPGIEYDLHGFIDLISFDSHNGYSIRDHKLHKNEYTDFQVETNLQLALYAYAFKFLYLQGCFEELTKKNKIITRAGFNSVKIGKECLLTPINYDIDDDKLIGAVNIVIDYIKSLQQNIWTPHYSEMCEYACGYKEPCLLRRNNKDISSFINTLVSETETNLLQEKLGLGLLIEG